VASLLDLSESGLVKPVLWQTNSPQTFRTHSVYCKVAGYFIKWIGIFKLGHKKAQKEQSRGEKAAVV
jgi:hypothetical protein